MRRIGCAVVLSIGLFAAPLAATAQQPGKMYRLGYLSEGSAADAGSPLEDHDHTRRHDMGP